MNEIIKLSRRDFLKAPSTGSMEVYHRPDHAVAGTADRMGLNPYASLSRGLGNAEGFAEQRQLPDVVPARNQLEKANTTLQHVCGAFFDLSHGFFTELWNDRPLERRRCSCSVRRAMEVTHEKSRDGMRVVADGDVRVCRDVER